jgi:hypothetical protein
MKKFYTKFFTKFKNNRCEAEVLPFEVRRGGPPSMWGFRNDGPGAVAIYGGPATGPISERCELLPDNKVELHGAHFVVQSRDHLGAVVLIASV